MDGVGFSESRDLGGLDRGRGGENMFLKKHTFVKEYRLEQIGESVAYFVKVPASSWHAVIAIDPKRGVFLKPLQVGKRELTYFLNYDYVYFLELCRHKKTFRVAFYAVDPSVWNPRVYKMFAYESEWHMLPWPFRHFGTDFTSMYRFLGESISKVPKLDEFLKMFQKNFVPVPIE